MTTAADIRADVRAEARRRLRDAMLDAARDTAVAGGWGSVRMGAVAARVGVSRQTLHAEFGTKEALGQELVLRETATFLDGVRAALDGAAGDLPAALQAGVEFSLEACAADPLLQAVLGATHSGDDALLPLLTSRGDPLLHRSSELVRGWVAERHPGLDAALVAEVVDSVVRLVVSHAVLPEAAPAVVAARLGRLAARALGLPEPG